MLFSGHVALGTNGTFRSGGFIFSVECSYVTIVLYSGHVALGMNGTYRSGGCIIGYVVVNRAI